MPSSSTQRVIALYIHFPWCVKKCPYCDFNSHERSIVRQNCGAFAYQDYLDALLQDLVFEQQLWQSQSVVIGSIFIGGGTPSLACGEFYRIVLERVAEVLPLMPGLEITMEANPGALEYDRFETYLKAGINRLSIGVQSFSPAHLAALGRIHSADQAIHAFQAARAAGFARINLDIMFGLPEQSISQGLDDLAQAIDLAPEHISWYQLTIEPNTAFYSQPPRLDTEQSHELWYAGRALLSKHGFSQYEVSAYARPDEYSRHNYLYWTFADYAAIGAGAHGKITIDGQVWRYNKTRLPAHYMQRQKRIMMIDQSERSTIKRQTVKGQVGHPLTMQQKLTPSNQPFTGQAHRLTAPEVHFEYLLNKLRLVEPVTQQAYELHTARAWQDFVPQLRRLESLGYLHLNEQDFRLTPSGFDCLDDLMSRLSVSDFA